MWPFAGPYCGRTSAEALVRRRAREGWRWVLRDNDEREYSAEQDLPEQDLPTALADTSPQHHYSPFAFQATQEVLYDRFHHDRVYWYAYTEWAERAHVLIHFFSIRDLYEKGSVVGDEELREVSRAMRRDWVERKRQALKWWRWAIEVGGGGRGSVLGRGRG